MIGGLVGLGHRVAPYGRWSTVSPSIDFVVAAQAGVTTLRA
jgi:hypothetical protein